MNIRERTELLEKENLSPFATFAAESRGRERPEEPDPIRTCFQRDRDRILHSKSFRRLKYKTQVFINPQGDHFRTRLTHTLEVAQIGRTIARALRLNEDLVEAIALGHDVGHTAFGHAGEAALDNALSKQIPGARFLHYEQSVRLLRCLENEGHGLNLTFETLDGIGGHSKGRSDLTSYDSKNCSSLEAAVVRVSDRIAYLNHDLDDAIRAGILNSSDIPIELKEIGDTHARRVGAMVTDLVEASLEKPFVTFSNDMIRRINNLKDFMFETVYLEYPKRFPDISKAEGIMQSLFEYYVENMTQLPNGFEGIKGAVDYVSGMTDRFAIRKYKELFVPSPWG